MGDLKSACWHSDGQQFVTGHADGSTCVWSVTYATEPPQIKKFYSEQKDRRGRGKERGGRERGGEGGRGEGRKEGRRGREGEGEKERERRE